MENEPITKLEIDKSRRKLTFADCEPGEEIDAVMAENEVNAVKEGNNLVVDGLNLLEQIYITKQISNKMDA